MFFLRHVPSFRISLLLLHSLFSYVLLIYNSIILSQKKFRNTSIISIFCIALLMVTYYHFDILFWYIFIAAYRLNDCRTRRINVSLPWNIYFHVVWSIWTTNWSPYCNIHVLRWTLRLGFECFNYYLWYYNLLFYATYYKCTWLDHVIFDIIFTLCLQSPIW